MSSVNVYLADGFEEIEALAVVDILRRAKIEAKLISITSQLIVKGAHSISVFADATISETDNLTSDMIFLPGGMPGTKNLEESDVLREIILCHHQREKPIAAICAAPRILGKLGLLKGYKAVCYPGNEQYLEGAEILSDKLAVSGKFITGKGAGVAVDFGLKIVEILEGLDKASHIRTSIIAE